MHETSAPTKPETAADGAAASIFTAAGLAAAFGVASCCALPLILSGLGIGGASLAGIALLAAPHRSLLLAVGIAGLAGGAFFLWRARRMPAHCAKSCAPNGVCAAPIVRTLTVGGLLAGSVLLALGYLLV